MATKKQIQTALDGLKETVALIEGLKSNRGFVPCLRAVVKIVPDVVRRVEIISTTLVPQKLTGSEKKELALDILMFLITPMLPWWVPASAIRTIAGWIIDGVVETINKILGKVWPK